MQNEDSEELPYWVFLSLHYCNLLPAQKKRIAIIPYGNCSELAAKQRTLSISILLEIFQVFEIVLWYHRHSRRKGSL